MFVLCSGILEFLSDSSIARSTQSPQPAKKISKSGNRGAVIGISSTAPSGHTGQMVTADYLRCQADACARIARACFDLTTAERLRHMASELRAKADDIDTSQRQASEHQAAQPQATSGWIAGDLPAQDKGSR